MVLAIDPGNVESAYVILDSKLKPIKLEKCNNYDILYKIYNREFENCEFAAIEMVASYGMAVGESVFETCVWIGKFEEALSVFGFRPKKIYRKDEKMNLCNSMRAKDSNIVQALIDRFAPNTPNKGKGTKLNPGWFHGFKSDIWQAYAVGVTYYDLYLSKEKEGN